MGFKLHVPFMTTLFCFSGILRYFLGFQSIAHVLLQSGWVVVVLHVLMDSCTISVSSIKKQKHLVTSIHTTCVYFHPPHTCVSPPVPKRSWTFLHRTPVGQYIHPLTCMDTEREKRNSLQYVPSATAQIILLHKGCNGNRLRRCWGTSI